MYLIRKLFKTLLLMNLVLLSFTNQTWAVTQDDEGSDQNTRQQSSCISHEEALKIYSHWRDDSEKQSLPADFVMHDLTMGELEASMAPEGEYSSNSITEIVSVPAGLMNRTRHNYGRDLVDAISVKVKCYLHFDKKYRPLEVSRSTIIKEKALGTPSISQGRIHFPMQDDRGQKGSYICSLGRPRFASHPSSFGTADLSSYLIVDMIEILSRSKTLFTGTICPAKKVYGEDQDGTQISTNVTI